VLGPKLRTAVNHSPTQLFCFSATELGFEIESGLHETDTAGFAKETIADGEITECFLEGPHPYADVFIVAYF
jgi:hypothetical protein